MLRCGTSNVYIKPECVCSFFNVYEAKYHDYSSCRHGEESDDVTKLKCKQANKNCKNQRSNVSHITFWTRNSYFICQIVYVCSLILDVNGWLSYKSHAHNKKGVLYWIVSNSLLDGNKNVGIKLKSIFVSNQSYLFQCMLNAA